MTDEPQDQQPESTTIETETTVTKAPAGDAATTPDAKDGDTDN